MILARIRNSLKRAISDPREGAPLVTTTTTSQDLMTTAEVARLLHRPQGTLRQWRHYGKGPRGWFYVEGLVMYPRTQVEQFLADAKVSAPAHAYPA